MQFSTFTNSETAIGFVALKWVREWSQILIPSPSWPYKQNEATLNWYFSQFVSKNVTFYKPLQI